MDELSNTTNTDIEITNTIEIFGIILVFICLGTNWTTHIYSKCKGCVSSGKNKRLLNNSYDYFPDLETSENTDCSVCLEKMNHGDNIIQLICGHIYHKDCVDGWLLNHNTCPNCRKSIIKK